MKFIQFLKVAGFALGKLALLMKDALGDITGSSLSFKTDKFLQKDHLADFLNRHAVSPPVSPIKVTEVSPLDIQSISSNCNNVVFQIDTEANNKLPDTLFVKLPSPSFITRWFFSVIGSWELEVHFFRQVAPRLPIRTPITYAATSQGSRFALIQENLHADSSVQLFTNLDMLEGPSIELVKRCLDTFAKLHASHFGLSEQEREAILPMSHHLFLSQPMKSISQTLNAQALGPCIKKQPDIIPDDIIAAYKKTQAHWDILLEEWFSGPLSLIHGDSHLGNFFVSGEQMGMLDFQAVHWGKGVRDVQYFLIDSLPIDVLQEHEQDLLAFYISRLAAYGVELDFDEAWQQYRGFTYHTLMTIVVSIGFGAMNEEQDKLMTQILKRSVAAVQRADYIGWLDDVIASSDVTTE
ncbi:MAG: phosphotransferase [Pseudomonadales bacterium]